VQGLMGAGGRGAERRGRFVLGGADRGSGRRGPEGRGAKISDRRMDLVRLYTAITTSGSGVGRK